MHDVLPDDQPTWERIRRSAREFAQVYNFLRIDTSILEPIELFSRSVGESTDIVEKQMFTVTAKGKERLALRPEGTASIARAYVEHGLGGRLGLPLKLFYEGPMFRYEQPQAGRTRQFHQIGFEILSADDDPIYDAQVILVLVRFLESLKIKNLMVAVNSIGCKACRPGYRRQLQSYYRPLKEKLCADCIRRFESNPLRLLDCKVEGCRAFREETPIIVDSLCDLCRKHFKGTLEYLDELALPYSLDHHLVRGLDYYTKTVFEVGGEGFDFALASGGRYDYLVELLGGKPTPGVGWAVSVERIVEVLRIQGITHTLKAKPKVFFIYIGELAKRKSLRLLEELRKHNIDVAESLGRESLRGQLRLADKMQSPIALIFGQKEAFEESIIMRDLRSGIQETIPLSKTVGILKEKLKG